MELLPWWMPVDGFPNYEISNLGVIRRRVKSNTAPVGFVIKQRLDVNGYLTVCLGRDGALMTKRVHRLVALTFLGVPRPGQEVAHNDGVKPNVRLSNLRIATKKENMRDRSVHGVWTPVHAERHPAAKLTEGDVLAMREQYDAGVPIKALADRFGVHLRTAKDVVWRRTWKSVP